MLEPLELPDPVEDPDDGDGDGGGVEVVVSVGEGALEAELVAAPVWVGVTWVAAPALGTVCEATRARWR